MQKIDRHALIRAGIAGGANKGSSCSATATSVVVVQTAASSTPSQTSKH
ncbi:hypothetical protein [Paraburkholderia rhizosphaerae]|uniref:Uncharacterized protein n=1 Tax=Paraburkholderia rhizosphaerae TaxID=480658 RepID=A0A4R8M0W7_9BURK|nr:hypothetical protein [Paraburkholderia rhizosphaerae]TDY54186.1 hypothetical protein BX592_102333 [Paraburkholderia rhizosphaerae]